MHSEHLITPHPRDPSIPALDRNERRTWTVAVVTAAMMVIEIVVGTATHSLALTADGWHMATHAGALGLSALAHWYARTRARADSFTFGTGKVYALAGFTNAVILIVVAGLMIAESARRLITPETVQFAEALPVAALGLVVNLISAFLLDPQHDHGSPPGAGPGTPWLHRFTRHQHAAPPRRLPRGTLRGCARRSPDHPDRSLPSSGILTIHGCGSSVRAPSGRAHRGAFITLLPPRRGGIPWTRLLSSLAEASSRVLW